MRFNWRSLIITHPTATLQSCLFDKEVCHFYFADVRHSNFAVKRNFCRVSLPGLQLSFHQFYAEQFCGRLPSSALSRSGVEAVGNRPQMSICECRWVRLVGEPSGAPHIKVFSGTACRLFP